MRQSLVRSGFAVLLVGVLSVGVASAQITNDAYSKFERGVVVQTLDNTPTVVLSYPVEVFRIVPVEATVTIVEHNWLFMAFGELKALFGRREASLAQVGATQTTVPINTFTAPSPTFSLVVNNTNPENPQIDVTVTGKTGMPIQWYIEFRARKTK